MLQKDGARVLDLPHSPPAADPRAGTDLRREPCARSDQKARSRRFRRDGVAHGRRTPQNIPLPTTNDSAGVWNVAAGAGYIWATTPRDGTLWRINPHTYQVTRIAIPYLPTMVTANAGGVWVTVRAK